MIEPTSRGVLDPPPSRGMTIASGATNWRLLTTRARSHSIDQAAVGRRQELVVENIRKLRPPLKPEILRELIDRPLEPDGIDAADAVVFHLAGQDVVMDHGAQAFELELAQVPAQTVEIGTVSENRPKSV